jgi:hypothetical protein
MHMYVDGVEQGAGNPTAPSILTTSLLIGRRGWNADPQYFQGTLDEVRLYNLVLSASEIQTLATAAGLSSLPELKMSLTSERAAFVPFSLSEVQGGEALSEVQGGEASTSEARDTAGAPAVPEPATLLLVVLGILGIATLVQRKRSGIR